MMDALREARATGRRREWPLREIVNAVFHARRDGVTLAVQGFPALEAGLSWVRLVANLAWPFPVHRKGLG